MVTRLGPGPEFDLIRRFLRTAPGAEPGSAAGVRVDWFHPTDHEFVRDSSFNPVWEGRSRLTPRVDAADGSRV